MTYPNIPGDKGGTDTGRAAAISMSERAVTLRSLIVKNMKRHGDHTTDEMAGRMGASVLAIRPRFSELRACGDIRDSGNRHENISGKDAIVWALVKKQKPFWTKGK